MSIACFIGPNCSLFVFFYLLYFRLLTVLITSRSFVGVRNNESVIPASLLEEAWRSSKRCSGVTKFMNKVNWRSQKGSRWTPKTKTSIGLHKAGNNKKTYIPLFKVIIYQVSRCLQNFEKLKAKSCGSNSQESHKTPGARQRRPPPPRLRVRTPETLGEDPECACSACVRPLSRSERPAARFPKRVQHKLHSRIWAVKGNDDGAS